MSSVMELLTQYGEPFLKKYEVKLGFMSFFVKACVDALKQFPAVNAEVRGTNIVYRNYYDIGVAIGGGKGLGVAGLLYAAPRRFPRIVRATGPFRWRGQHHKTTLSAFPGRPLPIR